MNFGNGDENGNGTSSQKEAKYIEEVQLLLDELFDL